MVQVKYGERCPRWRTQCEDVDASLSEACSQENTEGFLSNKGGTEKGSQQQSLKISSLNLHPVE